MRIALWFALTLLAASLCSGADVYPSKTVRIIVNFGPGSTADFVARAISQQLSERLGKPFVVDYRQGAGGTIGNAFVAKSAPDGYTLLLADAAWTISPASNKSITYDVATDFTPITQITRDPEVLLVSPALNTSTLKEFIALAQANPGKLNYGSAGAGGAIHLFSELFKIAAKVDIVHVPYKAAGGEVITALLGGHIQMLMTGVVAALPYVKSGQLRALAVTTDGKRAPSMPEVPSMSEAGVPGMVAYIWFGLAGPAGMPKEIVARLHAETIRAMAVPAVREQFSAHDAELVGSSPEEFTAYVRSELRRWAELVRSAGIVPN